MYLVAFVRAVMLAAFIKIVLETDRPLICAAVYTSVAAFFGLLFGQELIVLLIATAVRLGVSWLYFWLILRFQGAGAVWWGILIVGLLVVMLV